MVGSTQVGLTSRFSMAIFFCMEPSPIKCWLFWTMSGGRTQTAMGEVIQRFRGGWALVKVVNKWFFANPAHMCKVHLKEFFFMLLVFFWVLCHSHIFFCSMMNFPLAFRHPFVKQEPEICVAQFVTVVPTQEIRYYRMRKGQLYPEDEYYLEPSLGGVLIEEPPVFRVIPAADCRTRYYPTDDIGRSLERYKIYVEPSTFTSPQSCCGN